MRAEPCVAKAAGVLLTIFLPKQHPGDPAFTQLEASKNAAFEVAVLRVQSRLARDARMVW